MLYIFLSVQGSTPTIVLLWTLVYVDRQTDGAREGDLSRRGVRVETPQKRNVRWALKH